MLHGRGAIEDDRSLTQRARVERRWELFNLQGWGWPKESMKHNISYRTIQLVVNRLVITRDCAQRSRHSPASLTLR